MRVRSPIVLHGTAAFSARIALFFLGFVGVSFLANAFYAGVLMNQCVIERTRAQYELVGREASVVVLGDSHAKHAVDPRVLDDSFNYSSSGESYLQTYHRALSILGRESDVEILLLPVDLHSFSSYRTDSVLNAFHWRRHMRLIRLAVTHRKPRLIFYWLRAWFIGYIWEAELNLNAASVVLGLQSAPALVRGYLPDDDTLVGQDPAKRSELARSRATTQLEDANPFDSLLIDYFDKTLDLCDKTEMNVVLVSYPVSRSYHRHAVEFVDLGRLSAIVDNAIAEHSSVIGHLDYTSEFFDQEELFADQDHLNSAGASLFARLLSEDIQAMRSTDA